MGLTVAPLRDLYRHACFILRERDHFAVEMRDHAMLPRVVPQHCIKNVLGASDPMCRAERRRVTRRRHWCGLLSGAMREIRACQRFDADPAALVGKPRRSATDALLQTDGPEQLHCADADADSARMRRYTSMPLDDHRRYAAMGEKDRCGEADRAAPNDKNGNICRCHGESP